MKIICATQKENKDLLLNEMCDVWNSVVTEQYFLKPFTHESYKAYINANVHFDFDFVYLAYEEEKLVGFVIGVCKQGYKDNPNYGGYFNSIAVLKEYRGKGIGTSLLKAMEDRRSDFVVILAGYEEQMTRLIASNEGFSSRIKHTIYFPDYTEDEWKLGKKLRADEYDRMLEYVALYDYYSNFGITNKELVDDVEAFENKWKKTLPIKPGTYRDFDYKKLDALADKYWNKIWEWMRTYGRALWT